MSERKPTLKQQAFAEAYFTPGSETYGNGVQSAKKAEYKGSYYTLSQTAIDNLEKPVIKALKDEIQQEMREKLDHDRDNSLKLCKEALEMARAKKDVSGFMQAVKEMDVVCGLQRENAPNKEREAAIEQRKEQDTPLIREIARKITDLKSELSPKKPDIKLRTG